MVVLLSNSDLNSKLRLVYIVGFLFILGQMFITVLLFSIFSRIITNPFKHMIAVMQKVENGNLSVKYVSSSKDEIAKLGNALNNMIEKLKDTIDREYKAELSKRNAEFSALQSQINPHFLYNLLNSFVSLNRLGQKDELEKSIISMTGLMRYTISNTDFATIAEEFHFLEQYCELQKLRFSERLNFSLHYEPVAEKYKIPRLLLQPLVENAVIHGIEPLDRKGYITMGAVRCENADQLLAFNINPEIVKSIEFDLSGAFIGIFVIDDGCGFDMNGKILKKNVGLSNVEERLKIAYGNSVIKINSIPGKGTTAIIIIPEKDMLI
jgi:two-component system, sensor histidine kinase YesM